MGSMGLMGVIFLTQSHFKKAFEAYFGWMLNSLICDFCNSSSQINFKHFYYSKNLQSSLWSEKKKK